jgi:hypothetical protein
VELGLDYERGRFRSIPRTFSYAFFSASCFHAARVIRVGFGILGDVRFSLNSDRRAEPTGIGGETEQGR